VSARPTGTVTFLFTDIEGSTRLLEKLGPEQYGDALAAHRRLLRAAFAAHGGHGLGTEGDSFFVAFESARDACVATAELQRRLDEYSWPEGCELRVRAGLHTGEPLLSEEGYVGVDVHRAARICAAAHGGQTLLSRATHELAGDVPVEDLGEHLLKDLVGSEHLYQLLVEGLPRSFPPLRTLNATNLPAQPTQLIGRHVEIETLLTLIGSEDVRHITLTGAGGSGKTRLALHVAAELVGRYADGVFWVPLAPVDTDGVFDAVAEMIGAPSADALDRYLRDRELLLLLDNFEHVLDAAPRTAELLASAPRLDLLVTSRAPLHVSAERVVQVEPLPPADAIALFTDRAREIRQDFEPDAVVEQMCARLDGLPLAIELAAARLRHLDAPGLLARLDRSLDVLTGGARDLPDRQQTLRATLDWSYRLLEPAEQLILERLVVFAGAATLEQAEAVCVSPDDPPFDVLDALSSLVDKNLVRWFAPPDGPAHYFMLETVREYGLALLEERGEAQAVRRRHRDFFLELAVKADSIERVAGIAELQPARNNLRAALQWSLEAEPRAEETLRFAYELWRYWTESGASAEGRRWLDAALAADPAGGDRLQARARDAAAFLAAVGGDFERAFRLLDESEAIARSLTDSPLTVAWILFRRGQIESVRGGLEAARRPLLESAELFGDQGYRLGEAWALLELHRCSLLAGELEAARDGFAQVVELERAEPEGIARWYAEALLAATDVLAGETAVDRLRSTLSKLASVGSRHTLTTALLTATAAYRVAGDGASERAALLDALAICNDSGLVPLAAAAIEAAASVSVDEGWPEAAARLCGAAGAIRERYDIRRVPFAARAHASLDKALTEFGDDAKAGAALDLDDALELATASLTTIAHGERDDMGDTTPFVAFRRR
jgi:predicted ATPase/class 3 adenylate cyclase